jgi:C4-dicarboxylate transporter DctQ subunit
MLSNLIGAGFSFFLVVTGVKMVALAYEQQHVTVDVELPVWIPYIIMPIGTGLLGIYFLLKFYRAMKGDQKEIIGHLAHEEYVAEVEKDRGGVTN